MVTIKELRTLKPGDIIDATGLYYKVLGVTKKGLYLTDPFCKNQTPTGKWFSAFNSKFAQIIHIFWHIIRANSVEKKLLKIPPFD